MKRGGLTVNASSLIGSCSCRLHNGNGNHLRHSEAHKRKNEGVSRRSGGQSECRRDRRSRNGAAVRRGCVQGRWGERNRVRRQRGEAAKKGGMRASVRRSV